MIIRASATPKKRKSSAFSSLGNRHLVALMLCFVPLAGVAQDNSRNWALHSPSRQFGDDAILSASVEDIAGMRRYEIEAFARALADCQSSYWGEDDGRACNRSWDYFLLIYSRPEGAIGHLSTSVRTVWSYMRAEGKNGSNVAGAAARFKVIREKWSDAIRLRYTTLQEKG